MKPNYISCDTKTLLIHSSSLQICVEFTFTSHLQLIEHENLTKVYNPPHLFALIIFETHLRLIISHVTLKDYSILFIICVGYFN